MIEFTLFGVIELLGLSFIQYILLKKKIVDKIDIIPGILFIIYSLVLTKIVFFPIPFQEESIMLYKEINGGFAMNVVPLKSIIEIIKTNDIRNIFYQIAGNFLLLLPMGIYISVIFSNVKFRRLALIIISTSVFIEVVQLIIGFSIGCQYRIVDVDDIILNVFGGIIGLAIGVMILPLYRKICNIFVS